MTPTTHPPTPPGCPSELWASICSSQPTKAITTTSMVFAANTCPEWCVSHPESADDPSVIHEGPISYFGDDDVSPGCCAGVNVMLEAEWGRPGLWPPRINIYATNGELTADQARSLSSHLLELADVAEQTMVGAVSAQRPNPID